MSKRRSDCVTFLLLSLLCQLQFASLSYTVIYHYPLLLISLKPKLHARKCLSISLPHGGDITNLKTESQPACRQISKNFEYKNRNNFRHWRRGLDETEERTTSCRLSHSQLRISTTGNTGDCLSGKVF